jgi:predicted phage terminase large subunit-like protein
VARAINVPVFVTMAIDPALSADSGSDYTGFTVVGTDPEGIWYVIVAENFKGVPDEVINRAVRHAQTYKPQVLSLEATAAQILYRPLLVPALMNAGLSPTIHEYKAPPWRSKAQRIESLQPMFKQNRIFIREGLEDLIDQLDRYPEVEHDDLLDSLTQHLEISRPPKPGEVHPSVGRDWFERFTRRGGYVYEPPKDEALAEVPLKLPSDGTWTGGHGTATTREYAELLDRLRGRG